MNRLSCWRDSRVWKRIMYIENKRGLHSHLIAKMEKAHMTGLLTHSASIPRAKFWLSGLKCVSLSNHCRRKCNSFQSQRYYEEMCMKSKIAERKKESLCCCNWMIATQKQAYGWLLASWPPTLSLNRRSTSNFLPVTPYSQNCESNMPGVDTARFKIVL